MPDYSNSDHLFLGFDLSTQQLKIIVTNEHLDPLQTYNVEFDSQFKDKYGVHKGVITGDEGDIVSPVAMWLDAIDYLFTQMKNDGFPFKKVVGISGSGQQHGSVYWSQEANNLLKHLNPDSNLSEQLKKAFSWEMSPNWQDHSTLPEAKAFHDAVGKESLAKITGSRAHLRFTGLQIRKFITRSHGKEYESTSRISLVSSFVTSILLGQISELEQSDACGMNLYDINKSGYSDELLAVAAGVHTNIDGIARDDPKYQKSIDTLKEKLGPIQPITYKSSGSISNYFVEKYGFSKDCNIYSFTGDNLATILSLPLQPNDCLISLGTSTTVLLITENYQPSSQYHLFKHPTMPKHYMGMICYSNGALAREKARDEINKKHHVDDHKSWDKFDEILDNSNEFNGKLGIYFPIGEIVPQAPAQTIRAVLNKKSDDEYEVVSCDLDSNSFDIDDDALAIVESQTLSCRLRAGPMLSKSGYIKDDPKAKDNADASSKVNELYQQVTKRFGKLYTDGKEQNVNTLTARPNKCYYAGGASNNLSIIHKMGQIFGPINGNYKVEIPNACALGGAYKASWSYECEQKNEFIGYDEYIKKLFDTDTELGGFKVDDRWLEYFDGVGMLAKMEEKLLKTE
ncbi:Xks1 xylulokinase [Candida orthopsilosis Co 90-125]|uniref:Xylulose kinase n=1 Tax=Candida orthopsilosis (strain 90-125) TaxID=1136231 RepID=H8WZF4_CANO9|nr:Xks1 xylulokinase [Candida orthopsilosis Co 90-125]CCG21822.1 Xks1 xylulokinase [Candida orthopsilosis Co 90-125]